MDSASFVRPAPAPRGDAALRRTLDWIAAPHCACRALARAVDRLWVCAAPPVPAVADLAALPFAVDLVCGTDAVAAGLGLAVGLALTGGDRSRGRSLGRFDVLAVVS